MPRAFRNNQAPVLKLGSTDLATCGLKASLINKVGAVFCTTATTHGGLEMTMHNLITPMFHQGMIVVGLPGNVPENALYGSYYGAGVTCPVDSDELMSEEGIQLGRALGRRVSQVTGNLTAGQ